MTLVHILVFIAVAIVLGLSLRERGRLPILLATSVMAVYALQPPLPVRGLDFWLPTATLALAVLGWILTTSPEHRTWHTNWLAVAILCGIVLGLGLTRFFPFSLPLTASRPPQTLQIVLFLVTLALVDFLFWRFSRSKKLILSAMFVFIILLFIVLKVPSLSEWVSRIMRSWNGQSVASASPLDIRWLGIFIYCLPTAAYLAGPADRTPAAGKSGRVPGLYTVLSCPGCRTNRPDRAFPWRPAPSPGNYSCRCWWIWKTPDAWFVQEVRHS